MQDVKEMSEYPSALLQAEILFRKTLISALRKLIKLHDDSISIALNHNKRCDGCKFNHANTAIGCGDCRKPTCFTAAEPAAKKKGTK